MTSSQTFHEVVMNHTSQRGVDMIIDFIGGPYFKDNLDSLKLDGRLVLLSMLGGGKVDDVVALTGIEPVFEP